MSDFYLMMDVGHVLKQQNNSHSSLCKLHMFVHTTAYVNSTFAHMTMATQLQVYLHMPK